MRSYVVPFVLLAWIVGIHGASAREFVILDSTVPELASGRFLDGTKPLVLAVGGRVTLMAGDGTVATLQRPFSGIPDDGVSAADGRGVLAALARLILGTPAPPRVVSFTRGGPGGGPPEVWAVDVLRTGTYCAVEGTVPRLWRRNRANAESVEMKALPEGAEVAFAWPAGAETVGWPEGLTLKDKGEYLVERDTSPTAAWVTMRVVPADLPNKGRRVAWMADAGCTRQARQLLAGLY